MTEEITYTYFTIRVCKQFQYSKTHARGKIFSKHIVPKNLIIGSLDFFNLKKCFNIFYGSMT